MAIVNTHFFFRIYEFLLEFYIHFLDRFGMEVHFTRYLYFAIAGGDKMLTMYDWIMIFTCTIPVGVLTMEYLVIPPYAVDEQFKGTRR